MALRRAKREPVSFEEGMGEGVRARERRWVRMGVEDSIGSLGIVMMQCKVGRREKVLKVRGAYSPRG